MTNTESGSADPGFVSCSARLIGRNRSLHRSYVLALAATPVPSQA